MSRGRVEMRRIGNDVSRRAAFGKRRRGLLKKAHELAVLCGVDLGVFVFDDGAGAGKQFDYCSPHTSWSELIERYESITNHQFQFQGINHDDDDDDDDDDQQRREHDRLEASVRRQQTGEDLPSAAMAAELDDLERRLERMLCKVREMKDKLLEQQLDESQNKVHILEDQNSFLRRRLMGEEGQQRAAVAPKLPATALGVFFPEVEQEEEELTSLRLWPRQLPDV